MGREYGEYQVRVSGRATKQLKKLLHSGGGEVVDRIENKFHELKRDPFRKRPGMNIKLISTGKKNLYRLREGRYRIAYHVDVKRSVVLVTNIFRREQGYR